VIALSTQKRLGNQEGAQSPPFRQTIVQNIILAFALGLGLMAIQACAQVPKHSFAIMTGGITVISDADILEYRFAEHALIIRGESSLRLGRLRPAVTGTPFDVVVDGERIYSGRFVPVFSSMNFKEPTIWIHVDTNQPTATVIICGPSFNEPAFQPGTDPRVDQRVSRALAGLGKLTPGATGGASESEAFSHRVAEVLAQCEKLTPGTTRAEFLNFFQVEGGLRSITHQTFVHRQCPYIKVDVEFTNPLPQKLGENHPSDRISKISKPYLGRTAFD
jgi:hypothetical protein